MPSFKMVLLEESDDAHQYNLNDGFRFTMLHQKQSSVLLAAVLMNILVYWDGRPCHLMKMKYSY
jgi:hypothetical protein